MSVTGSTSEAARSSRQSRGCLGVFFVVFLLIGLILTGAFFVRPLYQIVRARDWRPTPCTILKSGVESHRGKSTVYSVAVTFEYSVEDQRYTSSRYTFVGGSSSGYAGKKAIVDRLPPGAETTCYVNRRDPSDAVLERGLTLDLFFGLFPLIFVLIGGGGLYGVLFHKKKPPAPGAVTGLPAAAPATKSGPTTLKPAASPAGRLGCFMAFALFWNGITSIFVGNMISGWVSGHPDGCLTVFLIPFELIGLGLIGGTIYYFLALFNPRPTLRVSVASAALGDTVEVEWETSGNLDRVKSFSITLEGREEATYRRGKSSPTEKSTFATIEIAKAPRGRELRRGKANVTLPADSMHTFKSSNNKFLWSFQVKGDIPRWPDINEEFQFDVLPQRPPPGGPT
jgi:hypothetical protein